MSRHKGRKRVLDILYAADIRRYAVEKIFEEEKLRAPEGGGNWNYASGLLNFYLLHRGKVDKIISQRLKNWTMERLSVVDRALLRSATAEILEQKTAASVVVSEAVKLAEEFSSPSSPRFVNGVLGKIMADLPEILSAYNLKDLTPTSEEPEHDE